MNVSELIGKQVLSPKGETLGYVKNVFLTLDYTSLASVVFVDGNEDEQFFPRRAILANNDVLIVNPLRLKAPSGRISPIGKSAFSDKGENLGVVVDVLLDEGKVAVKNGEETIFHPVENCLFGETVVVHRSPVSKRKIPRRKSNSVKAEEPKTAQPAPVLFRQNLLGKRVRRNVYSSDGYPIILEGELVTPSVVQTARRHNKLLQLTVNTIGNFK